MHRYEVRALDPASSFEGIFRVEALGPAAAATQAFIVTAGGRPPEVVDAMRLSNTLGEHRYRLSLADETTVEMIVRLLEK